MEVADFLSGAGGRRTETVYLSPDPDALSMRDVAEKAADGGSLADSIETAREASRASSWKFVVSSIPAKQWGHLEDKMPATAEQKKAAKEQGSTLSFDPDRFPQAAIAACLRSATNPAGETIEFDGARWADGVLTIDPHATDMSEGVWSTFTLGEWRILWATVATLNGAEAAAARQTFMTGSAKTRSGDR